MKKIIDGFGTVWTDEIYYINMRTLEYSTDEIDIQLWEMNNDTVITVENDNEKAWAIIEQIANLKNELEKVCK